MRMGFWRPKELFLGWRRIAVANVALAASRRS
jgi:hypothetical protein